VLVLWVLAARTRERFRRRFAMMKFTRVFALLALIAGVVLPALPAEAQIGSGSATGIDLPDRVGVTITGRTLGPVACPPFASVNFVIFDGLSDVTSAGRILVLDGVGPDHCIYDDSQVPRLRLLLGNVTSDTVSYRLEVRQDTYFPGPIACSQSSGTGGTVDLHTAFSVGFFPFPVIVVDEVHTWRCFGPTTAPIRYLRFP
jgi:hypothetical protein